MEKPMIGIFGAMMATMGAVVTLFVNHFNQPWHGEAGILIQQNNCLIRAMLEETQYVHCLGLS